MKKFLFIITFICTFPILDAQNKVPHQKHTPLKQKIARFYCKSVNSLFEKIDKKFDKTAPIEQFCLAILCAPLTPILAPMLLIKDQAEKHA